MIKPDYERLKTLLLLRNKLRIVSLCFVAVLFHLHASGQERPKVGLVLSGGGAKGLAHIGVLKAIDEAGLKVDYVTGTSMGSIVGAMYAAGYSGEQIEQIAEDLDWIRLLSGQPAYNEVRIDEKDEFENSSVSLAFNGFKKAPSTGLLESEEIWIKFSEILFPVSDVKDFDDFSIPFKCIATDLTNGAAVVLDTGEIVYAIRASMAIPGVFAAVDYKDTKLVDGGIVRNFPASDVKAMGADIVIGVNVFNGLSHANELSSSIDVMYQITNYRDALDLVEQKKLCDVIIAPELDDYSPASFDVANEIIEIGNNSGEEYLSYFKNLADSLNAIEAVEVNINNRLPNRSSIIVDSLQIEGLEWTSEAMLMRSLNLKVGERYTPEELSAAFKGAYSSLSYKYVYYQVIPSSEDHCILKCMVKENELHHLNFGLSYHSFTGASIIVNSLWRDLIFNQSRTMFKLNVGENWRFHFQHKQKMGKSLKNLVYLNARADRLGVPIYRDGSLSYLFEGHFYEADLGYSYIFNNNLGMSIGVGHKETFFEPSVSVAQLSGHLKQNFLEFKTEYNTLNRRFFPQKGSETNIIASLGVNRSYNYETNLANQFITGDSIISPSEGLLRLHLAHRAYFPLNDKFTLFENVNLAYAENGTGVIFDEYMMGGVQKLFDGQVAFAGLKTANIHSHSIASLGLGAQYQFYKEFYTILRLNVAVYDYDNPFKKEFLNDAKCISGGGLSLAYYLPLLPMEFTVMYSPYLDEIFTNASIGFSF